MADEATAPTETETPAPEPVAAPATAPANDNQPAPANDNAQPQPPTEEEFLALVDRFGGDKALQIVARKLNYAIDGAEVSVAERKKFRDEQRAAKQQLAAWRAQITGEVEGKVKESAAELEFARALKSAHETGDYDGVARALGKKDWNDLQGDYIARLADPNHKELLELRRRIDEREKAEQQQREQWQRQQAEQQRQQQVIAYKQGMAREMKGSDNAVFKVLADNPDVVNMVYAIRADHYQKSGVEMPLNQVLVSKLPGSDVTLQSLLKGWREQLVEAFGGEVPKAALATAPVPTPEPQKAKGKTSPTPPVLPSAARKSHDDREWTARGAKALEEAFRQEAERAEEERRKGNSAASA